MYSMIYFCHNYKPFLNKIGLLFIQILNAKKLKFKNGLDVYSSYSITSILKQVFS